MEGTGADAEERDTSVAAAQGGGAAERLRHRARRASEVGDGRPLSPQQALELVPHLLSTPMTLGHFGPRRIAAHLLMEVGGCWRT